jgi:outer membrane protein assembly factor BamE (lipoprotein component of BamABCDE complex)
MYVARFGSDGKLRALEQRLTEENFQRLKLGASRAEDIRELLGPPHKIEQFARMQREVWSYPWHGLTSWRLLLIYLSDDKVVREIYSIEDPEGVGAEGDSA